MKRKLAKKQSLTITTLSKYWHDKDEVLLHAAFQILVNFIEQEKPNRLVDWSYDKPHRHAWKEITSLYKWWKSIRPKRKSCMDSAKRPRMKIAKGSNDEVSFVFKDKKKEVAYRRLIKKSIGEEKKWHDEDQINLHRLIEIRPYLWV